MLPTKICSAGGCILAVNVERNDATPATSHMHRRSLRLRDVHKDRLRVMRQTTSTP